MNHPDLKLFACCILFTASLSHSVKGSEITTLEKAIAQAIEKSESLKIAAYDIGIANTALRQQRARFLPSIEIGSHYQRLLDESDSNQIWTVSGIGELTLFQGGRRFLETRALRERLSSKRAAHHAAKSDLIYQTALAYFRVLARRETKQTYDEVLKLRQKATSVFRRRYRRGVLSEYERNQAEIDLEFTSREFEKAETDLQVARIQLQRLVSPTESEALRAENLETPRVTRILALSKEENDQLAIRDFEWRALRAETQALEHERHAAYGYFLPEIESFLRYDRAIHFPQSGPDDQWTLSLGLTFPLFNRLEDQSRLQRLTYELGRQQAEAERMKRDRIEEIARLRRQITFSHDNLDRYEKVFMKAKKNLLNSERRYRSGRISVNDLLLDQERFLKAKLGIVDTRLELIAEALGFQRRTGNLIHLFEVNAD